MSRQKSKYLVVYIFLVLFFLIITSCGKKNTQSSLPPSESEKISKSDDHHPIPEESKQTPTSVVTHPYVVGKITIVDSAGQPLENMAGIATGKPNAFDEPLARGNLSGPDGVSTISIPKNTSVFIRAWDPILRYFPNNYFEIPPTDADYLEDMQVLMLEASIVELQLFDKDDQPVQNENVGLMMFHPKLGPWWPCDGHTDEEGTIQFKPLPAGMYNLRIKTERGMVLEIKEVKIPPASTVNLGKVKPR